MPDTDVIQIEQVRKSFGSVHAVDRLDLIVSPGCIYGMLGPNGAGKTTTIRMMMNIIAADQGRIEILGELTLSRIKDRIGYLPEERGLYRKMRVADILRYFGTIKGITRDRLRKIIPHRLQEMELQDWASRRAEELSKGMQQKLQFLAATIADPELVILDEPFAGLDPVNVEILTQYVLRLRDQGCTILFSTHMMEKAERLCDSVMLMNKGAKILDGPVADLLGHYDPRQVIVETVGEPPELGSFATVQYAERKDQRLEITLHEGSDPQELLAALMCSHRLLRFEVKRPTLNELFMAMVRDDAATASNASTEHEHA